MLVIIDTSVAAEMVNIDALLFGATDKYNTYHTRLQLKDELSKGNHASSMLSRPSPACAA